MEKWLILSYFANMDGNPASHHIDDRLEYFKDHNIEITLLSSFSSKKHNHIKHIRLLSLMPLAMHYEIRKYIKEVLDKNIFFGKILNLIFRIIFLPKFIERFFVKCHHSYSWVILASIYGIFWVKKNNPKVIYTTGGYTVAHKAGLLISKATGVPLVSEFQDPIPFFNGESCNEKLEKQLAKKAKLIIFLTKNAAISAKKRLNSDNIDYVYSGSTYQKIENTKSLGKIKFAHIGTLSGSRNLTVFLKAMEEIMQENSQFKDMVEVIIVGSRDKNVTKEIADFRYKEIIKDFKSVKREEAKAIMYDADVLLLIQNAGEVSVETIPSKTFEYLMSGKLIFGLTYKNDELNNILIDNGHYGIDLREIDMVKKALIEIFENKKEYHIKQADFSVKRSVKELVAKIKERI